MVGQRGVERTDRDGAFRWAVAPQAPLEIIVVFPDGRVAQPIRVTEFNSGADLVLEVQPALAEAMTIVGAAPAIDVSPGASATSLPGAEIALRNAATLSQSVEIIPGVSAISEGQAAAPAIRGLARGRTLILVDGGRASTERRAGPNASFLDPAARAASRCLVVRALSPTGRTRSAASSRCKCAGPTSRRRCACASEALSAMECQKPAATSKSRPATAQVACSSRRTRVSSMTTTPPPVWSPIPDGGIPAREWPGRTAPAPIAGPRPGRAISAGTSAGRAATRTPSSRRAPTRIRTA